MSGAPGLMICGTHSDSGKSTVVAGLCRVLARRGLKVAPFKAQNMALNSAVTPSGHEIGRAQAAQALAAGVEAEVAMNPILLKPTGERTSQVVVRGRPWAVLDAASYQDAKEQLWPVVAAELDGLRSRYDVIVCEGAGSPAEINLLRHDIVNLRVAAHAGFPALLVGDIERGGVFASLYGTVALLPPELGRLVKGFLINKFRGDPSLLCPGLAEIEARTGIGTLGVLPWLPGIGMDAEDSLALARLETGTATDPGALDVAVIRLPRLSNFTDLDALGVEPSVRLRLVERAEQLGEPDLLIVPGSKATVADLAWTREHGLAAAIVDRAGRGTPVLGICGGYQMLGRTIEDPVESRSPAPVPGLGLLGVSTVFHPGKTTRQVTGQALGHPVHGYEIRHGHTHHDGPAEAWVTAAGEPAGSRAGAVFGTSVHGLFESDGFRRAFLAEVAALRGVRWEAGPVVEFGRAREEQFDRIADALEEHMDMKTVLNLIGDPS